MAGEQSQLSLSQFLERLKGFEGYTDHLYLDTVGKVTVGVGLMFESADRLVASHISFRFKTSGKLAVDADIRDEFKRISKLAKGHHPPFYRIKGFLTADSSDLQGRLVRRLANALTDAIFFYNTGKPIPNTKFEEYADLPTNVQLALLDMAFNLGRGRLGKFQKLRIYLKQGDWTNAAKSSHRRGIQSSRNEAIYNWIFNQPKDLAPPANIRLEQRFDGPGKQQMA
jgi:GH24 family phage-related lysozyme (muramidase)